MANEIWEVHVADVQQFFEDQGNRNKLVYTATIVI